jgi:hypothetical protein
MKREWLRMAAVVSAALLAAVWTAGCEDSGQLEPVGVALEGHWSGEYSRPGYSAPITAEIRQNGSDLFLTTSREGEEHFLSGTISADRSVVMMDAVSGQTWSSFGEITETSFQIHDYINHYSELQNIVLHR